MANCGNQGAMGSLRGRIQNLLILFNVTLPPVYICHCFITSTPAIKWSLPGVNDGNKTFIVPTLPRDQRLDLAWWPTAPWRVQNLQLDLFMGFPFVPRNVLVVWIFYLYPFILLANNLMIPLWVVSSFLLYLIFNHCCWEGELHRKRTNHLVKGLKRIRPQYQRWNPPNN